MYRHVGFRRPAHRVECAAIRSLSDSLSSGRSRFAANRSLLEACSNEVTFRLTCACWAGHKPDCYTITLRQAHTESACRPSMTSSRMTALQSFCRLWLALSRVRYVRASCSNPQYGTVRYGIHHHSKCKKTVRRGKKTKLEPITTRTWHPPEGFVYTLFTSTCNDVMHCDDSIQRMVRAVVPYRQTIQYIDYPFTRRGSYECALVMCLH